MKTIKCDSDLILEFCHPQATEEPVFALLKVSWTAEPDGWDTPGSFSWDYVERGYVDLDGNPVKRPGWLDSTTLENEIQKEIEFLDLGN